MPQAQTVELPKRLPLAITPENRAESVDKDARLVNCYVEKQADGGYQLYKRPGLAFSSQPSGAAGAGQGVYNWKGSIYTVVGGRLYKAGVDKGAVNAANGVYRFSQCLGGTPKLQLGNGVAAYNYDDGGGLVQITDVDFPATFVKGWAYLDGTTYVMDPSANIKGSDLNAPASWDPLNTILAQIEPDAGIALAKQLVYVIAIKQWSTEVFYDAANATGSPLGTVQGAKANFGGVSADSVQDIDGTLLWLTTNRSSGVQVGAFLGLKFQIVSTPPIERLLQKANTSLVYSWQFKRSGHKFYVVTFPNSNLTLAYDLSEQHWIQLTDGNGNYLPIVSSTYTNTYDTLVQHATNGKLYTIDAGTYADDGVIIPVDAYLPNFDAGTKRRKLLSKMFFVTDQVTGSILQVRCNDADFAAGGWTNFRHVDFSQPLPYLDNCGTFTRRAYHFRHRCNTQMRIAAVDLQLDLGTL